MYKKLFNKGFKRGADINRANILSLIEKNPKSKLLDLGCDTGKWTWELGKMLGSKKIYGLDIVDERLRQAQEKGIRVVKANLNEKLPYRANTFDVVHSNQVIEHVGSIALFVSEVYRILKPGGYVIASTENGSSWHNIFAAVMGWQIFSLTNIIPKQPGIGNPLAYYRGSNNAYVASSWVHKTILNYLGLKELFELYGFKNVRVYGAGYFPLPASLGKIDPRHAHFITVKGYK
jgi:ubiquinone/menaquinone biosynthesis C-methylase UbiE